MLLDNLRRASADLPTGATDRNCCSRARAPHVIRCTATRAQTLYPTTVVQAAVSPDSISSMRISQALPIPLPFESD